jgi:hypothetical protein
MSTLNVEGAAHSVTMAVFDFLNPSSRARNEDTLFRTCRRNAISQVPQIK